jgi:hypothetical protein
MSTRTVPDAPAAAGGFTISGNPSEAAKSRISLREALPRDWAQGIPPFRSTSFIAGLSRQRNAVWTEVPEMPQASRTCAAGMMWASTVASSRSTESFDWSHRTFSIMTRSSQTFGTCSKCVSQRLNPSSSESLDRSPIPVTVAPTSWSARANSRWLMGKDGSTRTTCIKGL